MHPKEAERLYDRFESFVNGNGVLTFTQHYKGVCRSCKSYSIDLVLNVVSDGHIPYNAPAEKYLADNSGIIEKIDNKPIT